MKIKVCGVFIVDGTATVDFVATEGDVAMSYDIGTDTMTVPAGFRLDGVRVSVTSADTLAQIEGRATKEAIRLAFEIEG